MSIRRPRIRRKLWPLFLVALIAMQFLIGLVHSSPALADAASDDKRRILTYTAECLQDPHWADPGGDLSINGKITSLDQLSQYASTPLKGDQTGSSDDPTGGAVVVGMDMDQANGVQDCATAVRNGIRALTGQDMSDAEADSWLLNAVTGQPNFNSNATLTVTKARLNALQSQVSAAWGAAGINPDPDILRSRALAAVGYCFDQESSATKTGYAFTEQGYYFYPKSVSDVMSSAVNAFGITYKSPPDQVDADETAQIQGVNLGFSKEAGTFTSKTGFFPLGEDVLMPLSADKGANGKFGPGFISCDDIKNSADWLFQGATIDASGNITVNGVTVSTPAGGGPAGGVNGQGDTTDQCESTGFSLNWILCSVFNMFADATNSIFSDIIEPFLYTSPISTDSSDPSFQAWSAFRVYGNVFLVIAMLVIVFGQAIGGGLIDAYTAKKVMPRILIAAIMLNLSVYIVGLMVDISNVLGKGIGEIMTAPLQQLLHFTPSGSQQATAFGIGGITAFFGAGTLAGVLGAIVFGKGVFLAKGAVLIGLSVVVPALLALLSVFATLVIRRGIILILIISSPVAFALYCLPNTEKYFKKWWDLLLETLLVYPIVVVIFTSASILSAMTLQASTGGKATGIDGTGVAGLVAFSLQVIPLFLIPFAFKFAGNTIGKVYETVAGGATKIGGAVKARKEQAQKDVGRQMLTARQRQYDALGRRGDTSTGLRRMGYRQLQGRVGGYNLHQALAEMTAEQMKEAEAQKDAGIDDQQRALTVNKAWALAHDQGDEQHVRTRDGRRQFKTLGGRWVNESDVDQAHERWDGNMAQMQWSLGYEMQKATTQEQQDYLYQNFGRLNEEGSGQNLSDGQMGGIWQGAAFAKQNTDRQWKHYTWGRDANNPGAGPQLSANGLALMQEIDERQGNYAMSQQSADTWTTMQEEYHRAQDTLNNAASTDQEREYANEVVARSRRIANNFATQYPSTGGTPINVADGQPVQPPAGGQQVAGGGAGEWVITPTGAPARTQEEIGRFVQSVFGNEVHIRNVPGYGNPNDPGHGGTNTGPSALPVRGSTPDNPQGGPRPGRRNAG